MKTVAGIILSTITTLSSAFADQAYTVAQDGAIEKFAAFAQGIENGNLAETKITLSGQELYYLNGIYLYCTLKNGACPLVLDAILETDIFNSQLEGKAACPQMLLFWKEWIDNGLEQRVDYGLGTGFVTKYFEFRSTVRPRYLKCSGSVSNALTAGVPLKDFVSKRYATGSEPRKTILKTVAYLKALKEQVPDAFIATGAYKQQEKSETKE